MEIKIPKWADNIEDQGVLTFIAFTLKICEKYGYESWYYVDIEDAGKLLNKCSNGLLEWLRKYDGIETNLGLGQPYEHTLAFKLSKPNKLNDAWVRYKALTEHRQQLIWIYTLGCLNHNIINPNNYQPKNYKYNVSTKTVPEFKVTREASSYIKVKNRKPLI